MVSSSEVLLSLPHSDFIYLYLFQIHLHAGTYTVLNVTFIRAPSHALLKVDVPLVFIGDDVSPGLKKGMVKMEVFFSLVHKL